jgi:hypothetical protein
MVAIQKFIADDIFYLMESEDKYESLSIGLCFFEIYGGRCQVLKHNNKILLSLTRYILIYYNCNIH